MIMVIDGETSYELRGRVASIIRWLVRNVERINRGNGRIRFSFAGQNLKATLEYIEFDESINN